MCGDLKTVKLRRRFWGWAALPLALPLAGALSDLSPEGLGPAGARQEQTDTTYSGHVLPIFEAMCARCHGGQDEDGSVRTEAGLNVMDYERLMMGSEWGTVIEAGDVEGSYLYDLVAGGRHAGTRTGADGGGAGHRCGLD